MRRLKKAIYWILGIIAVLLILLIGIAYALTTDKVQQWLFQKSLTMLSEHLNTRVEADSLKVNPWEGKISLYGFDIDDLNKEKMLRVDTLRVSLSTKHLLLREIVVDELELRDASATIYKERKDSAANFQFVVDAFKKKPHDSIKKDKKKKKPLSFDLEKINITNLHLKWDVRDQKRKNEGRPHRGAFDANHIDAQFDLTASLNTIKKDSLHAHLKHLSLDDKTSGLHVRDLAAEVSFGKQGITLHDLHIDLNKTKMEMGTIKAAYHITPADTIKGTKKKVDLKIEPFPLSAEVHLQDISTPFAPVLSHFTTPLNLNVSVGGTIDRFTFDDIRITSTDKRLNLTAKGDLCNITKGKEALCLHFTNIRMSARNGIKEQIINHFAKKVNLKMVRQMKAVGDIRYSGSLGIFYKHEKFRGTLSTKFGNVNFNFGLNGKTKYMSGTLHTDSLDVGKLMNLPRLGAVHFNAEYEFNISSKRYKDKKGVKHGRLPQGWLKADVHNAKYGIIHFKEIDASMESNGSVATGSVFIPQKPLDLIINFAYTQTVDEQGIKIKPALKIHHKKKDPASADGEKPHKSLKDRIKGLFKKKKKADDEENQSDN